MTLAPGDYFSLRTLGTTGLRVTPLCIGTAALGDMPETFAYSVAEDDALAAVRETLDSAINFIDTAASYGDGESERRIGLVLRERGGTVPEGYVVGTKADRDMTTGEFSGPQMRRSVERSLDLLGLDRLQLVHLHDPEHTTFDAITAPGGPLEVLLDLKAEGLIEHLGVAGGPIDEEIRYVETGCFEVVVTHNRYHAAEPLGRTAAGDRSHAQRGRAQTRRPTAAASCRGGRSRIRATPTRRRRPRWWNARAGCKPSATATGFPWPPPRCSSR